MMRLALASLRHRKTSVVGAYLALLCAAAMVCACGVLLETGIHGRIAPQRYAGAPVIVTADQQIHFTEVDRDDDGEVDRKTRSKDFAEHVWLPATAGTALAAIPGAAVVPERSFPARLLTPDGRSSIAPSLGHNWASARLTPFRLVTGNAPHSVGQIVVDRGLAQRAQLDVGSRIGVQSTSSPRSYTVSGIAQGAVTAQSAIFFSEPEAQRLAAHGSAVTAYGVFGSDARTVTSALHGTAAHVATGDARGPAEFRDAATSRVKLTSMGGAIGGTSVVVAGLVLVGMFSLTVRQRRREFALLRAIGATPRQARRMVSREALVVGLAAGIPGALAGIPLAGVVRARFVSLGAVPDTIELARSFVPPLVALAATTMVAVVSSRVAARRIARIRPAEALTESAVDDRRVGPLRILAGLLATAGAVVLTIVLSALHTVSAAIPVTYATVLLWMIAAALLGPVLTRVGTFAFAGRRLPSSGFLAARDSRRNSRRVASVVTPLALLVGMTSTILFVPTTLAGATQDQTREGITAQHVVGAGAPGVPTAAVERIRSTPGVTAAIQVVRSSIWIGEDDSTAKGVTPAGLTRAIDPGVTSGSLRALRTGTIAMSTVAAGGRRVGDRVPARLGDGTAATFTLVAIYDRSLGFGDTLLAYDDLVHHVDDPLASTVLVAGRVDPHLLHRRLAGFPGLQVTDRDGFRRVLAGEQQTNDEVNLVFLALIIVFTALAVINTLAVATAGRRREVSLIRTIGATARQVRATLRWELALIVALATALGSVAAWLTLSGFSTGMVGSAAPAVDPVVYVLIVVAAMALGAVGTFVPARALLRRTTR